MNAFLLNKIRSLPDGNAQEVRQTYSSSPLMLRFIGYLENISGDGFSTIDAVCNVYSIKKDHRHYALFENRFYKLRKKLYTHLTDISVSAVDRLPDAKQAMQEAATLVQMGKLKEAQTILEKTEKECWRNNIFEILPDISDRLIQINQALNTINKNKALHKNFPHALQLHCHLLEAQNISRIIYEVNLTQGIGATIPLFNRLNRLVDKYRAYPRFKLIYNFVAGYYKTGAGGTPCKVQVINRHIAAAKKILLQYPDMPALHYTAGHKSSLTYRLNEMHAFSYYNALYYKEASAIMLKLFDDIMSSGLGQLKNEVLYTNTIHILVGALRFNEAVSVAEQFMKFIKDNHLYERLPVAYYELANIQASMYPAKTTYSNDFLLKRLDEYLTTDSPAAETDRQGIGLLLKVKLLAAAEHFDEALDILQSTAAAKPSIAPDLKRLTVKVLQARLTGINERNGTLLSAELKKKRLAANDPASHNWLRFLERIIR